MAYWLFAALFGAVAAIFYGAAGAPLLVYGVAVAAPIYLVVIFLKFVRSVFSRDAALSLSQVAGAATALAVVLTFLASHYFTDAGLEF